MKRFLITTCVVLASFAVTGGSALADSCWNASRPAPGPNQPVITGNWAWLPAVEPGAPPIWGFAPPGAPESTANGLPGANGNYTNGNTESLLGMSAICTSGVSARQTTNGIQTGCL
jgi:hypothetical protein